MMAAGAPESLIRVGRSLVSWAEIPARSALDRGDTIRFAHAVATLARQLVMAVSALNGTAMNWGGPWVVAPDGFAARLADMTSLADPARSATIGEELVAETLALLSRAGVPETDVRLGLWRYGPLPPGIDRGRIDGLARAIFERARRAGALAAAIADSWARGTADGASDVDIRLVVAAPIDLATRREIVAPFAEGGPLRQYGDEAYITSDQFAWSGRRIDVKYHPLPWIERALAGPFGLGGPIDLLELVALHDAVADPHGVLARLAASRDLLRQRAAEVASVSLAAIRDMPRVLSPDATTAQVMAAAMGPELEYAVRAWAGLNGRIRAFPKWLATAAPDLVRAPPDGWRRLRSIAAGPWTDGAIAVRCSEWREFVGDLAALERGIVAAR